MSALIRCPQCDTFVKPASLDSGSCPFCPSPQARSSHNPLPGLMLAATMAAVPGCSDSEPEPSPVYGISIDAGAGIDGAVYGIAIDASPVDASTSDAAGVPLYGIAPETDESE